MTGAAQAAQAPVAGSIGSIDSRMTVLDTLIQAAGGCAVMDGGLATELERRGANLNDPLWSAKCLIDEESSDMIRQVHLDYYRSGADICASASYQATIQGFEARGFTAQRAEDLLTRSVQLVVEARDAFWREYLDRRAGGAGADGGAKRGKAAGRARLRPLVAASIGSYGAFLADGSEYSGDYGADMTVERLMDFHKRRLEVLAASGADVIAFETIPCKMEAQAIVRLLDAAPADSPLSRTPCWVAFNSKDGRHVASGDLFAECVGVAAACRQVAAVGINCTPPRFIHMLLDATRAVTAKPIVVYPNSGESWDGVNKEWVPSSGVSDHDFVSYAPEWIRAGANVLGGCCRTTPHTIEGIAEVVHDHAAAHSLHHHHHHHHHHHPLPAHAHGVGLSTASDAAALTT